MRHFEECRLELAQQHVGPLDQRRHFVEQRLVLDRSRVTGLGGNLRELARNVRAPVFEAGDDGAIARERRGVAVGIGDAHRIDRGLEAVAVRRVAGLQSQHFDRHHLQAVQASSECAGRTNFTSVQPSAS